MAADIARRCLQLQRHLVSFRRMQPQYMPPVSELLLENDTPNQDSSDVEKMKLWFPSELEPTAREVCSSGLPAKEEVLQEAQCRDALDRIQAIERAKISMIHFRNRNLRGQAQNTHVQDALQELAMKSNLAAAKYRHA